jgi:hypothetical protein
MACLTCSLVACGRSEDDLVLAIARDSSGVAIMWNPLVPLWEESPHVTEEIRIGESYGSPEYQFSRVQSIDVDSEGRIYVLERSSQHVRVFDQDGEFQHYIGRPGQGPGELGPGATPVMVWGEAVLVADFDSYRVKRFTLDGHEAGTLRFSPDEAIGAGWGVSWDRSNSGDILQHIRTRGPAPDYATRDLLLRWDLEGETADSILVLPRYKSIGFADSRVTFRPFAPKGMWGLTSDDRVLVASSSSSRIEVWTLEGELELAITMDLHPIDLTETQIKEAVPEVPDGLRNHIAYEVAPTLPVIWDIMGGPRGTIWAWVVNGLNGRDLAGKWHVFDSTGQFLGGMDFPAGFTPLRVMGDTFLGVQLGDHDVPYVVRLRLDAVSRW